MLIYYAGETIHWTDLLMAIGTLLLATVALLSMFFDLIKRKIYKPKLDVEIKVAPPDCHKTILNLPTGKKISDTYYFRFKIWNNGNTNANNVEVMIAKLFLKNEHGKYEEENDFLPLNLTWSHYRTAVMENINPGIFKHCDLGYIVPNSNFHYNTDSETAFVFDLIVKPSTMNFVKKPANYAIEILLSATNMPRAIKKYFALNIKDGWEENEEKMLKDKISIMEINKPA